MTDIIERAEICFRSGTSIDHLARELVADLKAARSKYEADYAEFFRIRGELVAELAVARAENERLHSWDGMLSLLNEHYPENIFPTLEDYADRDRGPRIISLVRQLENVRAQLSRIQDCR